MKKILSIILCIAMTACIFASTAMAVGIGPYTTNANTYYINPDTGVTDDGGSKNAAVGEGMCRSVIDETALYEYDGKKGYVTLRVLLLSNIRNLQFAVQKTKGDPSSYVTVKPSVMAEDAENDCADYRFEIPQTDSYIRCTAYVIPMSRDVTFYINLSDNLNEGGGDFVTSVKKTETQAAEQKTSTVSASVNTASNKTNKSAALQNSIATSGNNGVAENEVKSTSQDNEIEKSQSSNSGTEQNENAEETNTEVFEDTENSDYDVEVTEKRNKQGNNEEKTNAKSKGINTAIIAVIVIVVGVIALCGCFAIRYFIIHKKKWR